MADKGSCDVKPKLRLQVHKLKAVVTDVFPLVVGFPIDPTVVITRGITPSTGTGIPTHLMPDGKLHLIKYLDVVLVVV
jgi:hypothetical protein